MTRITIAAAAAVVAAAAASVAAPAKAATVFSAAAADPTGLTPAVDAFRAALGALNPPAPVNAAGGRRQINWDAAPAAISDPNPFPGDFFNGDATPRARGVEFQATGTTTGFELSSDPADDGPGQPAVPLFGVDDFSAFSPNRIFRQVGGDTFDVVFFDPADQDAPALSTGLGVVFVDVDFAGSTTMEFFGLDGGLLASEAVQAGPDGGLSFLGLVFDAPVVNRVSITIGEVAAMDDFIFGEPTPVAPVPLPASVWLVMAGVGGLAALRARGAGRQG